ncbi:hypothetical protein N7486_003978 [Penicillium sp. IBT 16267x]|nr:hypothetical protein N7486_003978 [Penicillium sp. IBT 16267x]
MAQIIDEVKLRVQKISYQPLRAKFYRTAPRSSITHIWENLPAARRKTGDTLLSEDAQGNVEFNSRDPE